VCHSILSTISAFAHHLTLSIFFCFFINYSKEHDFSHSDIGRTGKNFVELKRKEKEEQRERERERKTARKEIKKKAAIQLIIANRGGAREGREKKIAF
jgi:hypothetical protein